jgi:hypothetical protein
MKVQLSTPDGQTVFRISDAPQMPTITINAAFAPPLPNGAQTQFRWSVQLRFMGTETPCGRPGTPITFTKTTSAAQLIISPPDWGRIRGGSLTVSVSATANGQTDTAQLEGLRIVGTNPTFGVVNALLGTDPLRRIAHQESNFAQFGIDSWPFFSRDGLGGAGIMQITPANEDQTWDWKANVRAGVQKYNHCYSLGPTFINSVRTSPQFAALVASLNQARAKKNLPQLVVAIPDWSADQRIADAIRGYNGWAGTDPVAPTLHLHEYKLSLDVIRQLQITATPNSNSARAIWVQVASSERPQNIGDPDYVNHVLGPGR